MRTLFILTCLVNIAFAFGSLPWMPEKVATHFDSDGAADGFAQPVEHALVMSLNMSLLAVVFLGMSLSMPIMPTSWINMPNRNYWLNEENRPKTISQLRSFLDFVGIGIFLFFLFVQWGIFQANQRVPATLNMIEFWIGTCIFFIFIIVEIVRLHLTFRLPKGQAE